MQTTVTGRVSYVPVPSGGPTDLAGLLSLDLPKHVRAGEIFRVVLHQVVDSPTARPRPPVTVNVPAVAAMAAAGTAATVVERRPSSRHFLGAFQFSVLVQTRREMLPIIERAQANLRRVIATIPHENRWYPVIQPRCLCSPGPRRPTQGADGYSGTSSLDLLPPPARILRWAVMKLGTTA